MKILREAVWDQDRPVIEDLFLEYLTSVAERLDDEYGIHFEVTPTLERNMTEIEQFVPPHGRLLLVSADERPVGLGCLRTIRDGTGEIKRMYVRPEFRGRGYGRALLEALLVQAHAMQLVRVRLDSTRFMRAAHALYRSAGFCEIDPCAESEIPPEYWQHWVFMEKRLSCPTARS